MLDHNELASEETNEQNQQIIEVLRHTYDTHSQDAQSLARIRERLLKNSANSLPAQSISEPITMSQTSARTRSRQKGKMHMQFIHDTFAGRKTWQHRVSTLAAVVLVTLLVGSLVLVLTHLRPGSTGGRSHPGIHSSDTFQLLHGWTEVAHFSGTGSKTISNQSLTFSDQLWGSRIACTGKASDLVSVTFQHTGGDISTVCDSNVSAPGARFWPIGTNIYEAKSFTVLYTIQVNAPVGVSWQVQIARGPQLLSLGPGPGWKELYHSRGIGTTTLVLGQANGITLPKTWELVFVCTGSGKIHIDIPGVASNDTSCYDGIQQGFTHMSEALAGTKVGHIQLTTTDNDSHWQLVIASCSDNRSSCGAGPTSPAS